MRSPGILNTASAGRTVCLITALGLLLPSAGCVTRAPEWQGLLLPRASVRSARTTLIAAEIGRAGLPRTISLLDAIGRLRPEFLQASLDPAGATGMPVVYIDGVRAGDVSALEDIPASMVLDVRYLRKSEVGAVLGSSVAPATATIAVRLRRTG